MTATMLLSRLCYTAAYGSSSYFGKAVANRSRFATFFHDVAGQRVPDKESGFAANLRGLATTDMAPEQAKRLLQSVLDSRGWEIGKAVAECALREDSGHETPRTQ